jgi:predicted restriction endonuclease
MPKKIGRRKSPFRDSKRDYREVAYKKWRVDVLKRDGHKCQWMGCKATTKLQCHHIKKWATIPSLRYCVPNGITLCKEHHTFIKGREEQFEPLFYKIILSNANNNRHP